MRDYPFLPAFSHCFDPFPLLQHHPLDGQILCPSSWIHAKGTFPLSLIPGFRKQFSLAGGMLFNVASLVTMLFSLKGVGFQK